MNVPTSTLYTPSQTTGVAVLNLADQCYLGYKEKTAHKLQNIVADKTFYAVYYKALKGTNAQGQDFIWNNAIWRVVNTTANSSSLRLVLKASTLTQAEAIKLGFSNTKPYNIDVLKDNNAQFTTSFKTQTTKTYFFKDANDDGYSNSNVKAIIDAYYNSLADTTAVQAVTLNTPTWTEYTGEGYVGRKTSASNWAWEQIDSIDHRGARFYKDTRFETTLGGTKQAFALSMGDLHGAIGIPVDWGYPNSKSSISTLSFIGNGDFYFFLRSPGGSEYYMSAIENQGKISGEDTSYVRGVRPAMYLTVD